jgi:hypothetical protein
MKTMPTFSQRLEFTFATLARPLTSEDAEPEPGVAQAEARLGLRLPSVLRAYYRLAGRFDRFNRAHNRLCRPGEWSVDGGKLVFLEENQCVVVWGVEASRSPEEDPPVYQGTIIRGRPTEWHLEHELCSEFLLVMLHLQAVFGGHEFLGGSEITSAALEEFLTGWTPVGRIKELRALCREGGAACVLEDEGTSQLYVGARTERAFQAIEAELEAVGVGLDHY